MSVRSFQRSSLSSFLSYNSLMAGNTVPPFEVDYLIIAGGGGGGGYGTEQIHGGGGGAGGYLNSYSNELSGRNSASRAAAQCILGVQYQVSVGAGGAIRSTGGNSSALGITAFGGGFGGWDGTSPGDGGSGGGGAAYTATAFYTSTTYPAVSELNVGGGAGTFEQGFGGGGHRFFFTGSSLNYTSAAGGGGAGSVGKTTYRSSSYTQPADPGVGLSSSITGTAVTRAAGGRGSSEFNSITGPANTGNGGSGAAQTSPASNPAPGGSGVVILRYPSELTITIGAGLTGSTATVGSDKVTTITAGVGNVTWTVA